MYDSTLKCVRYFDGTEWSPCMTAGKFKPDLYCPDYFWTLEYENDPNTNLKNYTINQYTITNNGERKGTVNFSVSDIVLSPEVSSYITVTSVTPTSAELEVGESVTPVYTVTYNNIISGYPRYSGVFQYKFNDHWCLNQLKYLPQLKLVVPNIRVQQNNSLSIQPIATDNGKNIFNTEINQPVLKFENGDIYITEDISYDNWELSITSQLNNIDKITYMGVDYQPGQFFVFDQAHADQLVITLVNNYTFGDDVLTFTAKSSDGTEISVVEKDITFYMLDIVFNTTLVPGADGYYNMEAFYELIPTYYYPSNNKNQGISVTRQVLKHKIGLHFEGKGVRLKSIVFKYLMTRANSNTTSNVTYQYTNVLDQEVYDIPENNSITLIGGGYSGTDMPTSDYTSTGVLTVTTEFDDVYEFKFRITKTNMYIMWFNSANVFEGNIACDANFDPDCDTSQLPPLYQ